jgi:hypothetical protein
MGPFVGDGENGPLFFCAAANDINGTSRHFAAPQNLVAIGLKDGHLSVLALSAYRGIATIAELAFQSITAVGSCTCSPTV